MFYLISVWYLSHCEIHLMYVWSAMDSLNLTTCILPPLALRHRHTCYNLSSTIRTSIIWKPLYQWHYTLGSSHNYTITISEVPIVHNWEVPGPCFWGCIIFKSKGTVKIEHLISCGVCVIQMSPSAVEMQPFQPTLRLWIMSPLPWLNSGCFLGVCWCMLGRQRGCLHCPSHHRSWCGDTHGWAGYSLKTSC